jgi:hypothetical protein
MTRQETLDTIFEQPIYAPDGAIEGALVKVDDELSQLVVDRGDEKSAEALGATKPRQRLIVLATLQAPSAKGPSEHPVYVLAKIVSIDGAKPKRVPRVPPASPYNGKVVRFNYARHGEKNGVGVVLDSGDFIHLKPEGFEKMKLKVGDHVAANGDAWPLATGVGYVVEPTMLNGKPFNKPKH